MLAAAEWASCLPLSEIVRRHMVRVWIIRSIGAVGLVVAIGALFFLSDPQSVLVAAVGVLISIGCFFLLKVSAEPAVGTDDAPPSGPV